MADHNYTAKLWAGTEDAVKKAATAAFRYVLNNLKIGPVEHQKQAGNLGGVWYASTTSSVASQEFSIPYQQNQVPTLLLAGLPLNTQGAQIVPLEISQPADKNRIYLKSSSTGAPVYLYVEFGGS